MKKIAVGIMALVMLLVAGTVVAQGGPSAIALEKIPDAVQSLDLFSTRSHRQAFDHERTGLPYGEGQCDPSGEFTIHYWRTDTEVGAHYFDGCIPSSVSAKVVETLGTMDMTTIPPSLLITAPEGETYTVNLFCVGEGKRVRLTGAFARCETTP